MPVIITILRKKSIRLRITAKVRVSYPLKPPGEEWTAGGDAVSLE